MHNLAYPVVVDAWAEVALISQWVLYGGWAAFYMLSAPETYLSSVASEVYSFGWASTVCASALTAAAAALFHIRTGELKRARRMRQVELYATTVMAVLIGAYVLWSIFGAIVDFQLIKVAGSILATSYLVWPVWRARDLILKLRVMRAMTDHGHV